MTWIQLWGEGLGVRVLSSADRRREVRQQKRRRQWGTLRDGPTGGLNGRHQRETSEKGKINK